MPGACELARRYLFAIFRLPSEDFSLLVSGFRLTALASMQSNEATGFIW